VLEARNRGPEPTPAGAQNPGLREAVDTEVEQTQEEVVGLALELRVPLEIGVEREPGEGGDDQRGKGLGAPGIRRIDAEGARDASGNRPVMFPAQGDRLLAHPLVVPKLAPDPELETDVVRFCGMPDLPEYLNYCPTRVLFDLGKGLFHAAEMVGVREPLRLSDQRRLVVEVVINDALRNADFRGYFGGRRVETGAGKAPDRCPEDRCHARLRPVDRTRGRRGLLELLRFRLNRFHPERGVRFHSHRRLVRMHVF